MISLKWHKTFDEKQASINGNTEEEENSAKKTTDDADENAEENKIIHKNKDKVVTIEEEKKTFEYQETMNLDIENISIIYQQFWISIYEVIDDSYFEVVIFFPTEFLDQCKKMKMNHRTYQMKSNQLFKIWLWKMGCMHKWLLSAEGI